MRTSGQSHYYLGKLIAALLVSGVQSGIFIGTCLAELSGSLSYAQSIQCEEVFTLKSHAVAVSAPEIEIIINSIAALQLRTDLAYAKGDHSAIVQTLKRELAGKKRDLLNESNLSREELDSRLRIAVSKQQTKDKVEAEERKEKFKTAERPAIDGSRIYFNEIEPGPFDYTVGIDGDYFPSEITQPFSLAATQTTQIVWRKVIEAAIRHRLSFKTRIPDAQPSKFTEQDLNPVEQVSYDDVQDWLNIVKLLEEMKDPVIEEVFPGHKAGDTYRLPWAAEWFYVVRARGTIRTRQIFSNESEYDRHAWSRENSSTPEYPDGTTHPVAQRDPTEFDGDQFYDFYGNVGEWMNDVNEPGKPLPIDSFFIGSDEGARLVRGGSWSTSHQQAGSLDVMNRRSKSSIVGFRLVRVRP